MGKFLRMMGILLVLCICQGASGATWYVDDSVDVSGDGTSWETALKTIQEGINVATDGHTVIVAQGTYVENVNFKGEDIKLRSTDPTNPDVVANTIIDANHGGSVVTFSGAEGSKCLLSGFTLQNGLADLGGGICGHGTRATMRHNVITGNIGSGVAGCDGKIENNVIFDNEGSALVDCNGTIQNNTIYGNSATGGAGGLLDCPGTIRNCIIWGNAPQGPGQLSNCSEPTYSCIENSPDGGEGNIAYAPYFVDPENADFRLRFWSPCIDAGDPRSAFSNEPQPNGGRINIGAYGNTPEAASKSPDTDADGLPDDWELDWFGNLEDEPTGDHDADGISNLDEYRHGRDPTSPTGNPVENVTKHRCYLTIQGALSEADHADEVVVSPGIYWENISFGGKNVMLRSTDPSDEQAVAATIIDGGGSGSVVTFSGTEGTTCVLSGFTIQNGLAERGGGICGGTWEHRTGATIQNNIITGNRASGWGSGIVFCDGTIQSNVIYGNSAEGGGGLSDCHGTIYSNAIIGNSAQYGGGLDYCQATILNNTICGNTAVEKGGGLSECDGRILNCILWGNMAPEGSQVYDSSGPSFSCIQGWSALTKGNIADDPRFCDAHGPDGSLTTYEDNDYRLSPDSPCVDAGTNLDWMYGAAHLDGKQRITGGRADMGAYEYVAFVFGIKKVIIAGGNEARLTWSSRPGDTYTIWSRLDLVSATWIEEATIPSGGQTTTWTDSNTTPTRKFYRIELK